MRLGERKQSLGQVYNNMLGGMYYFQRDYNHAIEQQKITLGINPKYSDAIQSLGDAYEQMKDYKRAMEQRITLAELNGNEARTSEWQESFAKSGYDGFLRFYAKQNEAEGRYHDAAQSRAMLGEKDVAFADLERARRLATISTQLSSTPLLTISALTHGLPSCYGRLGCRSDLRFLTLWKDAVPDLPILEQAKAEYLRLQ
jgi:tetratricopeptide (TPR) repeat protein